MNLAVISGVKSVAQAGLFQLKKYSPEILTGVGIAAIGVGTVFACKATLEAHEIIDDVNDEFDVIEEAHDKDPVRFPMQKVHTAKVEQIIRAGLRFTKLYGPSILLIAGGVASILGGHGILRKRNAALALAYSGLNESFMAYRKRVANMLGESADKSFLYDYKEPDKSEEGIEDKVSEVLKDAPIVDDVKMATEHPYAVIFDHSNQNFSEDPGTNVFFLKAHQNMLNNKLRAQGYLFLNDVLKDMNFKPTNVGSLVGWIYRPNDTSRDNYVSFGMDDILGDNPTGDPEIGEAKRAFLRNKDQDIWLDFNVDGPIYNMINEVVATH